MNNSKIALEDALLSFSLEEPAYNVEPLRERESVLLRMIEALDRVKDSEDWRTLTSLIFTSSVENLEKILKNESEKLELDIAQIHQLQGQLIWSRKYADLSKLSDMYRVELSNIRKKYE